MAKKTTNESGKPRAESGEGASPAMELDVDVSPETTISLKGDDSAAVAGYERTAERVKELEQSMPAARRGDEGRPFCGLHNCLMKATSSSAEVTRYACPVKHCDQKEKRARGTQPIPREPQACPDIRCRGKQSFLEVDTRRSTTAHLSMVCPNCAFEIKVPRPMFNSAVRTYEREEGDLSAR